MTLLVPAMVATVAGVALLWPAHAVHEQNANMRLTRPTSFTDATVTSSVAAACGTGLDGMSCLDVRFRLPHGASTALNINPGAGQPRLAVGDHVRLGLYRDPTGRSTYVFDDYQRHGALGWLVVLTAIGIVAVARLRGLAALAGVAVSAAGVSRFVLPSLLSGHDPVAIALVACSALLFVTLYLAHGFSARTSAALVGTLCGLALCVGMSVLATDATRVTGLSSEDTLSLQGFQVHLDLHRLLVCSIVIGALGALNDVTITQASAVWELHGTDPAASPAALFGRAMRIGRDHIASSVYTLLFAYAGAALPALLVITLVGTPAGEVVNGDWAAVEIVRAAVGVLGLAAAVPLTTVLSVVVVRLPRSRPRPDVDESSTSVLVGAGTAAG